MSKKNRKQYSNPETGNRRLNKIVGENKWKQVAKLKRIQTIFGKEAQKQKQNKEVKNNFVDKELTKNKKKQ